MLLGMYTKAQTTWHSLTARFRNEHGAVATEYGLLLVLVALAIIVAAGALGLAISNVFDKGSDELGKVPGS